MDFLTWYFGYHWILSTLLTPLFQVIYSIWSHQPGMVAFGLVIMCIKFVISVVWEIYKENK